MSAQVSETVPSRIASLDRACQRLAAPIPLSESDTTQIHRGVMITAALGPALAEVALTCPV